MKKQFSAEFFIGNRARLREMCTDTELLIISANGLLQRNGDTTYPFRQDSSFWYLTGLDHPDLLLVMDGNNDYIIAPPRDKLREVFDGSLDTNAMKNAAGVKSVVSGKYGQQLLARKLASAKRVGVLQSNPGYMDRHGFFVNPAREKLKRQLGELKPKIKLVDIRKKLMEMRIIKQNQELEAIKNAVEITIGGFEKIHKMIENYKFEFQIEADLSRHFAEYQVVHAYLPIVAAGENACTLHYIQNSDKIDRSGLLLIDAGAEYSNYAADITRTYAVASPTKRQKDVLAAVLRIQEYAFSLLKPGLNFKEYSNKIDRYSAKELKSLRLINSGSTKEIRRYCPHSVSHFLGLDVHDVGDYEMPLQAGMVLTVEPGIYIPEEGIGVRIEDDVLITKKGYENLSSRLSNNLN